MNPKSDPKKKLDSAKNRLIKLPDLLWETLDNDAHRCRRSTTKQIEAILISYYELDDVGLDVEKVTTIRKAISPKAK
jgi:hypothetical protein